MTVITVSNLLLFESYKKLLRLKYLCIYSWTLIITLIYVKKIKNYFWETEEMKPLNNLETDEIFFSFVPIGSGTYSAEPIIKHGSDASGWTTNADASSTWHILTAPISLSGSSSSVCASITKPTSTVKLLAYPKSSRTNADKIAQLPVSTSISK